MIGHPALRLLVWLKLRAAIRAQARRLRKPSGILFALVAVSLFVFWIASLWIGGALRPHGPSDPLELRVMTQVGIGVLCLMTVVGSFHHRGLYLPKEEIELAFSSPVSRGDLVRYRLTVGLLRSILAGLFFGLASARRMPHGGFAVAGAMVTMATVPLLGQASALLLGDAENRIARVARRLPLRGFSAVLGIAVGLGFAALLIPSDAFDDWFSPGAAAGLDRGAVFGHPVVRGVLAPFLPWATMISAPDARTFWTAAAFCVGFWFAGVELVSRIPVDFRELSLATSADVAKRITRARKGGIGASAGKVWKEALSWRVPWLFGRGPFGAVAWLKTASIVRKARGTILFSTLVIAFVTFVFTAQFDGVDDRDVVAGAALLALVGTLYLCTGLRFDFRQDLDQMEVVKSFPLRPARLFLATILPEVVLVSTLLLLGILARSAMIGRFHPLVLVIFAFQPLVTLAWVALDNAVFLYAPVRYTPGQEGALQHMGRSVLLMLLRATLFGTVFFAMALPVGVVVFLYQVVEEGFSGVGFEAALAGAAIVSWVVLVAVDVALLLAGGRMLVRFDVARDRG